MEIFTEQTRTQLGDLAGGRLTEDLYKDGSLVKFKSGDGSVREFKVVRSYPTHGDADGPFPRSLLRLIKKRGGGAKLLKLTGGAGAAGHYFWAMHNGKPDGAPVWMKPAQVKRAMSYEYGPPKRYPVSARELGKAEEAPMGEIFTEAERAELQQIAERMSDEATELKLYIDNDSDLYHRQYQPILKNLMTKRAQGRYDSVKAVKLFMYLMDAGAKKYAKEHGSPYHRYSKWNEMFPKADRLQAAKAMVDDFEAEAKTGNYDEYIPKKYRKKGK
jgi:hypothetical protein